VIAWGNILDEAIVQGVLTDDERRAYLNNMILPTLITTYSADENDEFYLSIGYRTGSLRTGSTGLFALSGRVIRVVIDGKEIPLHDPTLPGEIIGMEGRISIFGMNTAMLVLEKRRVDIARGEHPIAVTMRTALLPVGDPKAKPVATRMIDLHGSVAVPTDDEK